MITIGANGKYAGVGPSSPPTFQALFHYFADPVCSNATLTVLATGHYSPGADSDRVQGATEFDFFVQSVVITVHDESTARNLNGLKVGLKGCLRDYDLLYKATSRFDF